MENRRDYKINKLKKVVLKGINPLTEEYLGVIYERHILKKKKLSHVHWPSGSSMKKGVAIFERILSTVSSFKDEIEFYPVPVGTEHFAIKCQDEYGRNLLIYFHHFESDTFGSIYSISEQDAEIFRVHIQGFAFALHAIITSKKLKRDELIAEFYDRSYGRIKEIKDNEVKKPLSLDELYTAKRVLESLRENTVEEEKEKHL